MEFTRARRKIGGGSRSILDYELMKNKKYWPSNPLNTSL